MRIHGRILTVTCSLAPLLAGCHDVGVGPEEPADDTQIGGAIAAAVVGAAAEPFGSYGGVGVVRTTGMFEGETSLGAFRMPFEVIAPEDPERSNGVVLVEPPHFAFGPVGRDGVLGRNLLFGMGFAYAAVGWGDQGLNILDPAAAGLLLADEPVASPGALQPLPILDEEILIQFVSFLDSDPAAAELPGTVERIYAWGTSQTAAGLMELQRNLESEGRGPVFDLTVLHLAAWNVPFDPPGTWQFLGGAFEPVTAAGRVLFVESEGDQLFSDAEQFRRVLGVPGHRLYEVAGAAHVPDEDNPLDHEAVARAIFVAGDRWVREGVEPPPSRILETAGPTEGDPSGIARDEDGNALGGVRLPDLAVGRALYIASDPATLPPGFPPIFAVLSGSSIDLACEPRHAGDAGPRFPSHGAYVAPFQRAASDLVRSRLLLEEDAQILRGRAAESGVGAPRSCERRQ